VELFVNGESIGKQQSDNHFFYFNVKNEGTSTIKAVAGEYTDEGVINKVEVFNEAYRLKEKGAILNWFDITEPEGFLSINDTMDTIMKNPHGAQVLGGVFQKVMGSMQGASAMGFEVNEGMMKMMGGFTLLRLTSMMGSMNVKFTKEDLLALNAALNQCPRA